MRTGTVDPPDGVETIEEVGAVVRAVGTLKFVLM